MTNVSQIDAFRKRAELSGATPDKPLRSKDGDSTLPPMEGRVTRLEVQMEHVDRTLTSIDRKLDNVNDRLSQLATKSELRTWQWQWIATGVAIIALTIGGITGGLALIASHAG